MIYLPIDGALGGMGRFGQHLSTGISWGPALAESYSSSVFAGVIYAEYDHFGSRGGHHPIPRWAGGDVDQWLYKHSQQFGWTPEHRDQLEREIRKEVEAAGVRRQANMKWSDHFREHPTDQRAVFNAIVRVYIRWDRQKGTRLMDAFRANYKEGRYFRFFAQRGKLPSKALAPRIRLP